MTRRARSTSERRRRNAIKVDMERLETRWLMHQGAMPWGGIVSMERMHAHGSHRFDAQIERWASTHEKALERV
jgi:hypothetical protein